MMSENNPDVIKELVAYRQSTIRDAVRQQRPTRYRTLIGHLVIRMGERIRGPEMNSTQPIPGQQYQEHRSDRCARREMQRSRPTIPTGLSVTTTADEPVSTYISERPAELTSQTPGTFATSRAMCCWRVVPDPYIG